MYKCKSSLLVFLVLVVSLTMLETKTTLAQGSFFTPGDLVVYRAGDGTAALASTGNPVFIDEYDSTGVLVKSLEMPTTANGNQNAFFASGSATSEGGLTISPNGKWIAVTGYAGTSTVSLSSSSVPRLVGIINTTTGSIDTSTAPSDFSIGNNVRSAVTTDGNSIWMTGAAGGVRYATLGDTSSSVMISPSPGTSNFRQVNIFGGQLYVSGSSGGATVGSLGTGLPTSANQPLNLLPGFPASSDAAHKNPYSYFLAELNPSDGQTVDTLYVADDTTHPSPTPAGGITKFSLIDGNWVSDGSVDETSSNYRGLTGVVQNGNVILYATRGASNNTGDGLQIVSLTDFSGFNGAFSSTPTVLASAGTNEAFRGIGVINVTGSPGDLNLDGHVDVTDVRSMMQALTDISKYESDNNLSSYDMLSIADLNHDGVVNNADLQALLNLLQTGGGSLSGVPEPSGFALAGLSIIGITVALRRNRERA